MSTRRLGLLIGLALLSLGIPLGAQQSITIEKNIVVEEAETQDNIFTLGGTVLVEGRVRENVMAVGGTITVGGEVGDSVVGIGSRILVKSTAVIKGDLVCLGGVLEKEPGCAIDGDTVYFEAGTIRKEFFEKGLLQGLLAFPLVPIILLIKLIVFFVWLFMASLGATLFPKPIVLASEKMRGSFWAVFGTGILALVVFSGLVIFFALLSVILIGVPFLLALIGAGLVIKLFGRLAVLHFIGDSFFRAFGSRRASVLGAVLLGLVLLSLVGIIPIVGFLASFFLNIVGWGVTVRTKFGTTDNWFKRKGKAVAGAPPTAP
jgi:hypothetical protein